MSIQGPSSLDDSKERRGIDSIYDSLVEFATNQLLSRPTQPNRLTQVEALRRHEKIPLSEEQIKLLASEQAESLFTAAKDKRAFEQKRQIIREFILVVRSKIAEPIVTPALVRYTLTTLKEQFDNKHKARPLVVSSAEKVAIIENEIARLESQPKGEEPAKVADAASKTANTDPLEIAKAALLAAKKEASDALALYEKPTDINPEHESFFMGFVHHVLNPKTKQLEAVTHEVQFCRPEVKGEAEEAITTELLNKARASRASRLKDVDTGVLTGIQVRVAGWNEQMPKALSTQEWQEREQQTPYTPTPESGPVVAEDPEQRKILQEQRAKEIRSLGPVADLNKQKWAVRLKEQEALRIAKQQLEAARARIKDPVEKAKLKLMDFHPLAKTLHELDEALREEFEQLGIKQIPKNKQSKAAASWNYVAGKEVRNTDFESRNPQVPASNIALVDGKPAPLTRAMLDPEPLKHAPREPGKDPLPMPLAYPPRRDYCKAALVPQLQRHLELGIERGYLVGRVKKVAEDKYLTVNELSDHFNKMKI